MNTEKSVVHNDYEKEMIEELMRTIDMKELEKFNPKLHTELIHNPQKIIDLQEIILNHEQASEAAAQAEAVAAAAENFQVKPEKTYAFPLFWAWFAPVFTGTGAILVKV